MNPVRKCLLLAARMVEKPPLRLSCVAIGNAGHQLDPIGVSHCPGPFAATCLVCRAVDHYRGLFGPNADGLGAEYWNVDPDEHPEHRELRVMALLFAAWSYE